MSTVENLILKYGTEKMKENQCAKQWVDVIMWKYANLKEIQSPGGVTDGIKGVSFTVNSGNLCWGSRGPMSPNMGKVEAMLVQHKDFPPNSEFDYKYSDPYIIGTIKQRKTADQPSY